MKRFRFPLQPVATLRAHQEMRAREAFADAARARRQAENVLAQAQARVAAREADVNAARQANFSATAAAVALADYRQECATEAESARALAQARKTADEKRDAYLAAHQRLEAVRKLEMKARALHRAETSREEQATYDDLAGRAHAARQRNGTRL